MRVTRIWQQRVKNGFRPLALTFTFEFCYTEAGLLRSWSMVQTLEPTPYAPVSYPNLNPDATLVIDYQYPNLFVVRGAIWLVPISSQVGAYTEQISYGFDTDPLHRFEGVMFEVPGTLANGPVEPPVKPPIHPPICPPIHPIDPMHPSDSSPVADILPASGRDGELFPYVYMRIWPEPEPDQVAKNFVQYPFPTDASPSGSFLRELVVLRNSGQAGARAAMRALAVAYIEGKTGADAPYVPDLAEFASHLHHGAILRQLRPTVQYPAISSVATGAVEDTAADSARDTADEPIASPADDAAARVHEQIGMDPDTMAAYVASSARETMLVRIWQSWFALVIELGYATDHRDALARVLVLEHLMTWLVAHQSTVTPADLAQLLDATMVLPESVFPLPTVQGTVPPNSPPLPVTSETITPYAIGDLQLVKQTLRGYRLGELAYVENVQAGERRETSRKKRNRAVETTTSWRSNDDISASTGQNTLASLTREALESCATSSSETTYDNFTSNYGPPTAVTLNGSFTTTETPGLQKRDVTRFARDVLDRAVERHASRVLESREFCALREAEESVSSIIDNSSSTHHRCAVYRWLDEVYSAYVVNYGNRLILEFLIENPAGRFINAVSSPESSASLAPVPPASLGIESYRDITPERLPRLLALYPDERAALPPAGQIISLTTYSGGEHTVNLPAGQRAVSARLGWALSPAQTSMQIQGVIGSASFNFTADEAGVRTFPLSARPPGNVVAPDAPEVDSISVLIEASLPPRSPPEEPTAPVFSVAIETCPSARAVERWQLDTYRAIVHSYQAQVRAHAAATAPDLDASQDVNARASNRAVERYTLKYDSFELLFERLEVLTGIGDQPSQGRPPNQLVLGRPRYLRFFETAFEWDEMSYSFFGAERDRPIVAALSARTAHDPRFRRFLDASFASVLVPVAPEHALAVLQFLAEGVIWDGPPRWIATSEGDIPLVIDLKAAVSGPPHRPPHTVRQSNSWPVVVPTDVAVLADAAVLSGLVLVDIDINTQENPTP